MIIIINAMGQDSHAMCKLGTRLYLLCKIMIMLAVTLSTSPHKNLPKTQSTTTNSKRGTCGITRLGRSEWSGWGVGRGREVTRLQPQWRGKRLENKDKLAETAGLDWINLPRQRTERENIRRNAAGPVPYQNGSKMCVFPIC